MAEIDDTYAEAFRSIFAEVMITARDRTWLDHAIQSATGNASSTILCDCEAGFPSYQAPLGNAGLLRYRTPLGNAGFRSSASRMSVKRSFNRKTLPRKAW
jgi:formylmethanofuran--tetrahydromethanopterin N-formyltransferase